VHRRLLITALAVIAAGTVAVAPADAKPKPKPFKGSQQVTDTTPDPSGSTTAGSDCSTAMPSQYPQEPGIAVNIPAPGKLKVSLDNKLDWALEIRDPKGNVIGSADGGTPTDVEEASAKAKKAGKYLIFACNLEGEPTVTVSWSYTPA
jgi:hypothetical protein